MILLLRDLLNSRFSRVMLVRLTVETLADRIICRRNADRGQGTEHAYLDKMLCPDAAKRTCQY